jgi:hypothetical protein
MILDLWGFHSSHVVDSNLQIQAKTTLSWGYLLVDQPFLRFYRIKSSEFVFKWLFFSRLHFLMQKSKNLINKSFYTRNLMISI